MAQFFLKNKTDQQTRRKFLRDEIFFNCEQLLDQSFFSEQLTYYLFKKQKFASFKTSIKNRCLLSGHSRAVNSRLRMSRRVLARKILKGSMCGFYRSVR
jgi:ribosomal protein S14